MRKGDQPGSRDLRVRAGAGRVTVDVCHAGINLKGVLARWGDVGYVTEWPFVPGLEVAGGLAEVAAADRPLVQSVPKG
jgi:NADPH:quinone reductase-like Zn-dependent oxidoreductase